MSHRLKIQHWHAGLLVTHEHIFKTFDEALAFSFSFHKIAKMKIYDDADQLMHEVIPCLFDELMYA